MDLGFSKSSHVRFYGAGILCLILFISPAYIFAPNPKPSIQAGFVFQGKDGTFRAGEALQINYQVKNNNYQTLKAFVSGSISNTQGQILHSFRKYIAIEKNQDQLFSFQYKAPKAGPYRVFVQVKNSQGRLSAHSCRMIYAPELILPPITRKQDFTAFWNKTKAELKQIPPEFKVIPKPSLDSDYYQVYLVEMKSLLGVKVKAWYRVPRNRKNLALVLQIPSLGGSFYNVRSLGEKPRHGVPLDFAVLSLNIRAHGNSKNYLDVGKNYHHLISHKLENLDQYIYRGAIADCIRALDFIASRKEINPQKVAVEGGSQGGALSLICAALDNRVKLCAPDVPFLSDIERLIQEASWVKNEFQRYRKTQSQLSDWRVLQHLSYFDTKNFARLIQVPVLMSLGLQDNTCPAITGLGTFNHIPAPKELRVFPQAHHEGGGAKHREYKFQWIRKHFGM